ncbi:MAG: LPS assembly protein LptD, partial [Pseudomonadota bacterium]
PLIGAELRYPFALATENATHYIEPIGQVIFAGSGGNGPGFINEDSVLVEFDETNLFETSRFPGEDRFEPGFRANLGIRYERVTDDGLSLGVLVGQVYRFDADPVFSSGTGLTGTTSDFVASLTVAYPPHLKLVNRALFDETLAFTRNETLLEIDYGPATVETSFVRLEEDIVQGADEDRMEVSMRAGYQVTPNWGVTGFFRHDFESQNFVRAGGGLTYATDCAEIDLAVSRRFTASENAPPSTSVGLVVRLPGFGTGNTQARAEASRCRPRVN